MTNRVECSLVPGGGVRVEGPGVSRTKVSGASEALVARGFGALWS